MDMTNKMERLNEISSLSVEEGLVNTGGETDLYLDIATEYALSAEKQIDKIQQFFEEKDIRNYTILVHSVKSSSRLIGATALSELAFELEKAGNAQDIGKIEKDTPTFLDMFRSLAGALAFLTEEEADENLPQISESMLSEAVEVMKDGADSFDLMTIESVMDQLADYKLPESFRTIYQDLKRALADVDYDRIAELLQSVGNC